MRLLRPSTLFLLGPLALGIAIAAGAWVALPASRDLRSFLWALGAGTTVGLILFGPLGALLAVGKNYPGWLSRHSWHIDFYSSLAMALCIGYLAACMRHSLSDKLMVPAFALIIIGAMAKTGLTYALRDETRNDSR